MVIANGSGAVADFGAQNCQYTIPMVIGMDVR